MVLAAGLGRRAGGVNKLAVPVGGRPVVRRVVESALEAGSGVVRVVVGARAAAVRAALAGLPAAVALVETPAGALPALSLSLRVGLAALPQGLDAVLICLGDMPLVRADTLTRLIAAFAAARGAGNVRDNSGSGETADSFATVFVPVHQGRRGNPVLWAACHLPLLAALGGDRGGGQLFQSLGPAVREVPVDDPGVVIDLDTPADIARHGGPGEIPATTASFPTGSFPTGSFPAASFPAGSFPAGSFPAGALQPPGMRDLPSCPDTIERVSTEVESPHEG